MLCINHIYIYIYAHALKNQKYLHASSTPPQKIWPSMGNFVRPSCRFVEDPEAILKELQLESATLAQTLELIQNMGNA